MGSGVQIWNVRNCGHHEKIIYCNICFLDGNVREYLFKVKKKWVRRKVLLEMNEVKLFSVSWRWHTLSYSLLCDTVVIRTIIPSTITWCYHSGRIMYYIETAIKSCHRLIIFTCNTIRIYRMSKKLLYHHLMYHVGLFLYFVCVMCLCYTLKLKKWCVEIQSEVWHTYRA